MAKTISAHKLRKNFGEIINETHYKGTEFIIERRGKPMAKISGGFEGTDEDDVSFRDLAGILSDTEANELKKNIAETRERWSNRTEEIADKLRDNDS